MRSIAGSYLGPCRVGLAALAVASSVMADGARLPYPDIAGHVVRALRPSAGERALVRYHDEALPGLAAEVRKGLAAKGVEVELLPFGPVESFDQRLQETDIYVWLPEGLPRVRPAEQTSALVRWLDAGRGRQVHFHWSDGTRAVDGLAGEHSAAFDKVYLASLDVDYDEIDFQQRTAIRLLRSGEVHVTTPAGTDLRFLLGTRPFTRQSGDASKERTDAAQVRIGREIELPCGVIRAAPLEPTVEGTLVVPSSRWQGETVKDLRLRFIHGKVVDVRASSGAKAFEAALAAAPVLGSFREIGIGFNPKLVTPEGEPWVAYYGYGAGVVRLSLGDNSELGGEVRGSATRWMFFVDATVTVSGHKLVDQGRLEVPEAFVVH